MEFILPRITYSAKYQASASIKSSNLIKIGSPSLTILATLPEAEPPGIFLVNCSLSDIDRSFQG